MLRPSLIPPLLVLLLVTFWPSADAVGQEAGFQVIVHAEVQTESLEAKQLSRIFLKKSKRWEDDSSVTVFDLGADSPTREAFSRAIHRKSISAIKSFWQRMIFSGRDVAPDELPDDESMIERVAATPGSVGYVSAQATLPETVKVLEVEEK